MDHHIRATYDAILSQPAPRDLDWDRFVTLWKDIADKVTEDPGARLAVDINGHREVFRRPHDGRVSIEDIELARHILAKTPDDKGSGHLLVVTIDERAARILDFDLDTPKVVVTEHDVKDPSPVAHHMRTVERHTGHDDEADLKAFFDKLAETLRPLVASQTFVLFGHGEGKANTAAAFVERATAHHPEVAAQLAATAQIDLSAATDTILEAKAKELTGR